LIIYESFSGLSNEGYVGRIAQEGQEEEEGSAHSILPEEKAEKEGKGGGISPHKLTHTPKRVIVHCNSAFWFLTIISQHHTVYEHSLFFLETAVKILVVAAKLLICVISTYL
jgi:hypothetical protein